MTRLHAGTAYEDITPDRPVPMGGYGTREGPSTGVHRPLSVTSVVITDGATTIGIASLDVLNVSRSLTATVRERITSIAPIDEVLLAATHTHSGPHVPADVIDHTPSLAVEEDASDVIESITQSCVDSLTAAYERLAPVTIRVGTAENRTTPINRRAADHRGRIPTGGIDPTLTALVLETDEGDETAVFNFALHPVCFPPSNTQLSPDWPAIVYDHVAEERGATTLFLNGAAGDINPRGRMDTNRRGEESHTYLESVGREMTETVLDAISNAQDAPALTNAPLVVDRRELRFPVKCLGDSALLREHLHNLDQEIERLEGEGNEDRVTAIRTDRRYTNQLLHIAEWGASELPATMQYVGIGPVGLLSMPGEAFVEHGIEFKERAAVDTLLPVGYANEYVGYIPTLQELENFGYEVWTAKIAPEAIVTFRDVGIELVSSGGKGDR
jgi:neutral ceramidase